MSDECFVSGPFNNFLILIQKCPVEKISKFFNEAINTFCVGKAPEYTDYSEIWMLLEWWDVVECSQYFLKNCENSKTKVTEALSSLPPLYQDAISDCIENRSKDIEAALLRKVHETSPFYLKDYDYKLKVTLASDKMAQMNEPRLELNLDIQEGQNTKQLNLDLSKKELKEIIKALEAATKGTSQVP